MSDNAYMRLYPQLGWRIGDRDGEVLDARVPVLLAGVRAHGTLRAAALQAGISYRAAWGLLHHASQLLGMPLVVMQRGLGATLTAAAETLLTDTASALATVKPLQFAPAHRTAGRSGKTVQGLRVVASHDLLLAEWCERWGKPGGVIATLAFRGSLESLSALAAGRADVAGFHLALPLDPADSVTLHRLLPARRVKLIRFVAREQGLIVARGNPLRLSGIADIARRRLRFVNRQAGSGTRMLIDQLLHEHGIAPGAIRGYAAEEHTHSAVAALVASGEADAGFGLKAAAVHQDLGFVPIRRERYWLAVRSANVDANRIADLCAALRAPSFARLARRLSGYVTTGAGESCLVSAAFDDAAATRPPARSR